jgi:hypothetical protein
VVDAKDVDEKESYEIHRKVEETKVAQLKRNGIKIKDKPLKLLMLVRNCPHQNKRKPGDCNWAVIYRAEDYSFLALNYPEDKDSKF